MIAAAVGIPNDLQFIVHVVALRPLARDVAEVGTAERVATGLGNEVELRAAAVGFAESAGYRQLYFLRARRVVAVSGHAAAVEGRADVHAVDLHRAFIAAAATRREEDHVGGDTAVLDTVGLDARGDCQEIPVTSGRRQRCNDLVTEHALVAGAVLNVHDRCLTSHRQGLLQSADAHLRVERHGHTGLQLDIGALHGGESGQGVRHGIDTGTRFSSRYVPVPSLTVVRTFSMRAGLAASTVTPGRIAPDVSRTTPAMDCADATCGNTHAMRARIPYNSHRGLSVRDESTTRLVIRCFSPCGQMIWVYKN